LIANPVEERAIEHFTQLVVALYTKLIVERPIDRGTTPPKQPTTKTNAEYFGCTHDRPGNLQQRAVRV